MNREEKGFTLLEVLFVVIVIAILAAIVIPRVILTQATAKENACDANLANINAQIETYYFNTGSWPSEELLEMRPPTTYDYFPGGIPSCPVNPVGPYRMNSTTHRINDSTHDHGSAI